MRTSRLLSRISPVHTLSLLLSLCLVAVRPRCGVGVFVRQGGLNRQYFLPFLQMFKRFMSETHVEAGRDFRLLQASVCSVCSSV